MRKLDSLSKEKSKDKGNVGLDTLQPHISQFLFINKLFNISLLLCSMMY